MDEAEGQFELLPPKPERVRKVAARPPFDGQYREADHQWLLNLCMQHLSLTEFKRISKRVSFFKDYSVLLRAAIVYFGVCELGWVRWSLRKRRTLGFIHHDTVKSMMERIEDVRVDGDVFERIETVIRRYRDGLI